MKQLHHVFVLFLLMFLGGCFSLSSPRSARVWYIATEEEKGYRGNSPDEICSVTRLGNVSVASPFDKTSIAVLRPDGTVAFDAYNVFASQPASLLREPAKRLLSNDGRFGNVIHQTSVASASVLVEMLVVDLSLDCRDVNKRKANVAVELTLIKSEKGVRNVVSRSLGKGFADASQGDYTQAFTTAFTLAVRESLSGLKIK
jgi:hypothetical protein